MHLCSTYLIVNDFEKSVSFYEKLLEMPVTKQNMNRFAQFVFEGHVIISLMNGRFDTDSPDKVVHKGEYTNLLDDLRGMALSPNTHKFVLNFSVEDLRGERERIKALAITENLSTVKYVYNVSPYYFFNLTDPDGNIIEVTGEYTPAPGEF
ncbi:MAG: VOC family protein [Oscillospiraceae bacterium]|jgi:lactoylglutathione lyase|nr:VOC family protein [Oscillospiraceae bacterium]